MKCFAVRSKRGFTLTELLVTIAIIGVLLSLAVVGAVNIQRNLKMTELDSAAREIFLAAQNTLTAHKAAGTADEVGENSDGSDEYWLVDGELDYLLPAGTVEAEIRSNSIAIRYNASSCVVLEVYYSETGLDAAALQDGAYSDTLNTAAASARREAKIGYYDGSNLPDSETVQLFAPQIVLTNDEELSFVVTVPNAPTYASWRVKLNVTVQGLVSGKTKEFPLEYDPTNGVAGAIIIDSLDANFVEAYEGFVPGEDIEVTASLSAEGKDNISYLPSKASKTANSLFASRSDDTVYIANARHLQNLEASVSGCALEKAEVVQVEEIIWPAGESFTSIKADGNIGSFDGASLGIWGLSSTGGLFSQADSVSLKNIHIINANIIGSGTVGTLANTASGANISGCLAYLSCDDYASYSAYNISGTTVGGLVGEAVGCTVTDSAAAVYSASGDVVGGLVGSAIGVTVRNSYASAENLSGSSKTGGFFGGSDSDCTATNCYAVGNISSSIGTRCGFDCGTAKVTQSYCAMTYYTSETSEAAPTCGFSLGSDISCAYWKSRQPSISDGARALGYAQLCQWTPRDGAPVAGSFPYREMEGADYPFSGIKRYSSSASLPHYGSWPVERTDQIVLCNSEMKVRYFAMLPANSETSIYAMAYENGEPAYSKLDGAFVSADGVRSGVLLDASIGNYSSNGVTEIELTSGSETGVSYVDLTAGDVLLRMVVVVYDAEVGITVTGENGTPITGGGTATSRTEAGLAKLTNSTTKAEARGSLAVAPSRDIIEAAITQLKTKGVELSADTEHFAAWESLYNGDPAVIANGEPDMGVYYFAPVNGEYYFNSRTDGADDKVLTVAGAASGTGTVAARWAMDTSLYASYHIRVSGVRVLIQKAEETTREGVSLSYKDNYPYRIDIIAEPGQAVYLRFTPKLFGGSKDAGITSEYNWNVFRVENGTTTSANISGETVDRSGVYSFRLDDSESYSTYIVTLEYVERSGDVVIGRSLDYTTFTVYRRALAGEKPEYLSIAQTGGWLNSGNFVQFSGSELWLEQIDGNGYDDVNTATLQSWVEGAGNTKTLWEYSADGTNWTDVTGHLGSLSVSDASGTMRATVQWNNSDQLYGDVQTGGSITVTGLDADVYGSNSFVFYLRASAAEATINGEYTSASKVITVRVLPKMELLVKSKVELYIYYEIGWISGIIASPYTFSTNRTDGVYGEHIWGVVETGVYETAGSSYEIQPQSGKRSVAVSYGPFSDNGTITYVDVAGDSAEHFTVNWDYQLNSENHIILDKDKDKHIEFSWKRWDVLGNLLGARIEEHPASDDNIGIVIDTTADNTTQTSTEGSFSYIANGKVFTRDEPIPKTWRIDRAASGDTYLTAYFHVVGLDVVAEKNGENIAITDGVSLDGLNSSVKLNADVSFPSALMANANVVWSIDNPDLIAFKDGVSQGESVTIVAKKYSSSEYSATVTAVCTVTDINGKTLTYTENISVSVPPIADAQWSLTHCTAEDADLLAALWPEDGVGAVTNLAFKQKNAADGCYTLIHDEHLGMDTMYLKLTGTLDGSERANIEDYFWSISNDWLYLDADTKLTSDKTTLYARLSVNIATEELSAHTFGIHIGNDYKSVQVQLCEIPQIVIMRNGSVVTNTSVSIKAEQTDYSISLSGCIVPEIYPADGTQIPLDSVKWTLVAAEGYDPYEFLSLLQGGDGTVSVSVRQAGRTPDFRVVIAAQSALGGQASAGFALVFLPEGAD